jgi:hypothetical protein
MTHNPDNQITFRGTNNRYLIAILILFMIFTFGDAINLRLMQ